MKITSTRVYRGPNLYAHFRVLRHELDLGILEQWSTVRLGETYIAALLEKLPGLQSHGCSYNQAGGLLRRMREDEGTWLGHVFEHVALELQTVAGSDVSFGKTRSIDDAPGHYSVVVEYENEQVGLDASRLALDLLHHLLPEALRPADAPKADWNFASSRDRFIRTAQRSALGPSTASLVKAAEERDIPWLRLNRYSLIQFGHGRYQKRIQATTTCDTSNIAVDIASDKEQTHAILRDLGLPVPAQVAVTVVEDAVAGAERMGYPVVVKPLAGNHGRGVSTNLQTPEQVATAFEKACEHGRTIVVESHIEGFDHRLLVVNGELVAAAKRVPGHVVGDGKLTISELVDQINADPRRGVGHEKVLTRLEFDHQAQRLLAKSGYDEDTVPALGEEVFLRTTANLSTGGTAVDVTDIMHPANREMAIRAIEAVGLDIGGVDFITTDISRSFRVTGGAICEVNAGPGFRMHVAPSEGTPRDVAGPVIDMLFPPGSPSRIPIASVTGTNGKTTTTRMLAHILKLHGFTVGMTSTDGVYIDGRLTVEGDMTGPQSAHMVLRDPRVDAAVMETARGGLLRAGLGYRRCNVAACLNISADHLGLRGIDTLEELARLKRIPIEVAQDAVVLNADDPLCLQMGGYTEARRVCYVTMNPAHPLVKEHIRVGGQAVVLEQGMNGHMITLYHNQSHMPLLWTHLIPATLEGRALHNVQNAMFAAALAFNMDVDLEDIRHGLRTFDTSFFQAPGRMNVFTEHAFKVILDYAHNPAAIKAMVDVVRRLEVSGRRIVVLAAPGDRRDVDIEEVAKEAAGNFDLYICRRDDNARGRADDEVPTMLQAALVAAGVEPSKIQVINDEQEAVHAALGAAQAGDLVLVLGDHIKRCWKQIIYFQSDKATPVGVVPVPRVPDIELPELTWDDGVELVRDERGVRIAPEAAD